MISPLLIGLFAGGSWSFASFLLIVAAFSGFLIRQPVTIVIKIYSHRRSERDVSAAWFWVGIYAAIGAMAIIGLVLSGYSYILLLAIPGIPIFAWYLWLVSRREERRQMGVELIATGVLALSAPAAYWVGTVGYSAVGWWLFLLTWFQGAASIVYAYLRLDQRRLTALPPLRECLIQGRRALLLREFQLLCCSNPLRCICASNIPVDSIHSAGSRKLVWDDQTGHRCKTHQDRASTISNQQSLYPSIYYYLAHLKKSYASI